MSVLWMLLVLASGRVEVVREYLDVPVAACTASALWLLPRLLPAGAVPGRWTCVEPEA